MNATHALLGITVLSTGFFTGLVMAVFFFFHRALKELSGPESALVMQRENPGSPAFVLTAVGLLAFWLGPILTSRFVAEPIYGGPRPVLSRQRFPRPRLGVGLRLLRGRAWRRLIRRGAGRKQAIEG